jgi:hypothetical protein
LFGSLNERGEKRFKQRPEIGGKIDKSFTFFGRVFLYIMMNKYARLIYI